MSKFEAKGLPLKANRLKLPVSTSLPAEDLRRLDNMAGEKNINKSELLRQMIYHIFDELEEGRNIEC